MTRKITRGMANIAMGLEKCLYMGNLDALRDWGHARDYVHMQWLMLQQEAPEDFVIATGIQHSVRTFINKTARQLGITLSWKGEGINEKGYVDAITGDMAPALKPGNLVVAVDSRYFRPSEVETLLGDPSKAKQKLGWFPSTTLDMMIEEMVVNDLDKARQHAVLKGQGFKISVGRE